MSNLFGIHEQALLLREARAEIIASNLANADTPNYKAKDIDFDAMLTKQMNQQAALTTTNTKHMQFDNNNISTQTKYRIPMQASLDGNTVDTNIEQTNYMENAMKYMASLQFINSRVSNVLSALKGE